MFPRNKYGRKKSTPVFCVPTLKKFGLGNGAQMLQRDKERRNKKHEIVR